MRYIFTLLLVFIAACKGSEPSSAAAGQVASIEVKVIEVQPQDIPITMEFVGRTAGATDAEIRARVDGHITKIHFQDGKKVAAGELLYEIDDAPYQAEVAKAKAALAEANARFVRADADLKRVRPLAEIDAVSKRDLDVAIANEAVARQSVEAAKAAVDSAEIKLSYTKITSPIAGIIGLSKAKVGEYVGTAPNPVILNTVSDLENVVVRLSLSEKEYLYFAKLEQKRQEQGAEASKPRELELVLSDGSIYAHKGKVKSVDRNIDAASGALAVEAVFPNTSGLLKPGLFAKIRVVADVLKNVIAIPSVAIRELQGLSQVAVVSEAGVVQVKSITLGSTSGKLRVIESGLEAGERIAVDNLVKLRNGLNVKANLVSSVN